MTVPDVPGDGDSVPSSTVRDVVHRSVVSEFTTATDGRPSTVPVTPLYDDSREVVVVSSPPAFAAKAERAAANPTVGLLVDGPDGPLQLTGTATVHDDDLQANARRVRELIDQTPPGEKRDSLQESTQFMQTRLGTLLLDWYALRVVIEVDVEAAMPVESTSGGPVESLPVGPDDEPDSGPFDRTVGTVVDADGRPRTWPLAGARFDDGSLQLRPPADVSPTDGQPACLLGHWFEPGLETLGQRLVRGRLQKREDGVGFRPASSFSLRNETALDFLRFVATGKRRTRQYFRERSERYRVVPSLRSLLSGTGADLD